MSQFAWRLVRPLQSFPYSSIVPSSAGGRYHHAGERVIYSWSSSEMAFLSTMELTGGHMPTQMVREKIQLPSSSPSIMPLSKCLTKGIIDQKDLRRSSNLSSLMKQKGLLGLWVNSEFMPSEQILILNPDAPNFAEVSVISSRTITQKLENRASETDPDY